MPPNIWDCSLLDLVLQQFHLFANRLHVTMAKHNKDGIQVRLFNIISECVTTFMQ